MADPAPALKDALSAARFRAVAREFAALETRFDAKAFLAHALPGLDDLTLLQRVRRMSESLRVALPSSYREALAILRQLAPHLGRGLISLVPPDFVALCGQDDFEVSMEALKFFTPLGSSEFAVREFLRRDLTRTLALMTTWSRDESEDIRRLASEGCRPRLPWSFRIEPLIRNPELTAPILENLRADPSLYVRKSVANHLNDITRDHPAWVLARLKGWPRDNPHTTWIAKRALRTLIKAGDRRALALIGAGRKAEVIVREFSLTPRKITLGGRLTLSAQLVSQSRTSQRLVVDYIVHYVKKSGAASAKVFKLKELNLAAAETVTLGRSQTVTDFTTRTHYPGRHEVELVINGTILARSFFDLAR